MWQLIISVLMVLLSCNLQATERNNGVQEVQNVQDDQGTRSVQDVQGIQGIKDDSYPIKIQSDKADFDEKTGEATHRGNVVVDQGTRHLTADRLIIHRNPDGKIDKMVAFGNPVQFHAYPAPGKPILQGKANIMRYFPYQDKIILEENAELTQNQKTIQGPVITYFLNTQVLSSESNSDSRTTIIIHPKEKGIENHDSN